MISPFIYFSESSLNNGSKNFRRKVELTPEYLKDVERVKYDFTYDHTSAEFLSYERLDANFIRNNVFIIDFDYYNDAYAESMKRFFKEFHDYILCCIPSRSHGTKKRNSRTNSYDYYTGYHIYVYSNNTFEMIGKGKDYFKLINNFLTYTFDLLPDNRAESPSRLVYGNPRLLNDIDLKTGAPVEGTPVIRDFFTNPYAKPIEEFSVFNNYINELETLKSTPRSKYEAEKFYIKRVVNNETYYDHKDVAVDESTGLITDGRNTAFMYKAYQDRTWKGMEEDAIFDDLIRFRTRMDNITETRIKYPDERLRKYAHYACRVPAAVSADLSDKNNEDISNVLMKQRLKEHEMMKSDNVKILSNECNITNVIREFMDLTKLVRFRLNDTYIYKSYECELDALGEEKVYSERQLKTEFSNYKFFTKDVMGMWQIKNVADVVVGASEEDYPVYEEIYNIFQSPGYNHSKRTENTFKGFYEPKVKMEPDNKYFLAFVYFIKNFICGRREMEANYFLKWIKFLYDVDETTGVTPVIPLMYGGMGTGKSSIVFNTLNALLNNYTYTSRNGVVDRFNGGACRARLHMFEELPIRNDRDRATFTEYLKAVSGAEKVEVREPFKAPLMMKRSNLILISTNNFGGLLDIGRNERRFLFLEGSKDPIQKKGKFFNEETEMHFYNIFSKEKYGFIDKYIDGVANGILAMKKVTAQDLINEYFQTDLLKLERRRNTSQIEWFFKTLMVTDDNKNFYASDVRIVDGYIVYTRDEVWKKYCEYFDKYDPNGRKYNMKKMFDLLENWFRVNDYPYKYTAELGQAPEFWIKKGILETEDEEAEKKIKDFMKKGENK